MSVVVSDASPLNYLLVIGHVQVLERLFEKVFVPPAVLGELSHARAPEPVRIWACKPPAWIVVRSPRTTKHERGLGPGEAAAIALAKEIGAQALLIDEQRGRAAARSHGLLVFGTIGILEAAAARDLLDLSSAFRQLAHTTFRIEPRLLMESLARDAARTKPQHPQQSGQGGDPPGAGP